MVRWLSLNSRDILVLEINCLFISDNSSLIKCCINYNKQFELVSYHSTVVIQFDTKWDYLNCWPRGVIFSISGAGQKKIWAFPQKVIFYGNLSCKKSMRSQLKVLEFLLASISQILQRSETKITKKDCIF